MRTLGFLILIFLNPIVQASEIREAEKQRSTIALKLELLKQETHLDNKKKKVITTELVRLVDQTKTLTHEMNTAERSLKSLKAEQIKTERTFRKEQTELKILLKNYKNELKAYYISGRSLKPNAIHNETLSDYLPFILDARKRKSQIILTKTQRLKSLINFQKENSAEQEEVLDIISDKKKILKRKVISSENLLASINRDLSTLKKRESALSADLKLLEARIRKMQQQSDNIDLSPMKGLLSWPTDGRVLRNYGQLRTDGFGDWQGMVISASQNSNVRAVHSGKVAYAGYLLGYGLVIVIAHNDSYATIYGHNYSLLVDTGDLVTMRQPIAIAGNTGSLDVTAVYFAITENGKPINPATWLN